MHHFRRKADSSDRRSSSRSKWGMHSFRKLDIESWLKSSPLACWESKWEGKLDLEAIFPFSKVHFKRVPTQTFSRISTSSMDGKESESRFSMLLKPIRFNFSDWGLFVAIWRIIGILMWLPSWKSIWRTWNRWWFPLMVESPIWILQKQHWWFKFWIACDVIGRVQRLCMARRWSFCTILCMKLWTSYQDRKNRRERGRKKRVVPGCPCEP